MNYNRLLNALGPRLVERMGRPRCPSRPRGDDAQQLPVEPPPDVAVHRCHRRTQLGVQVRQSIRRWNSQVQILGGA